MSKEFDIKFEIQNVKGLTKALGEGIDAKVKQLVDTISIATYNQGVTWITQKLKTTQLDYLNNFRLLSPNDDTRIIMLDPQASYLEDGYKSFDIKKGLLNSSKAKTGKDGSRYITVPLGLPTQATATNLADQLIAIELSQALRRGKDRLGKPVNLNQSQPGAGIVGSASTSSENHSYVRGAVRVQKHYNKTTQSTFIKFVRVSDKTEASKWWHPGFRGVHIFPDMERWAESELKSFINSLVL